MNRIAIIALFTCLAQPWVTVASAQSIEDRLKALEDKMTKVDTIAADVAQVKSDVASVKADVAALKAATGNVVATSLQQPTAKAAADYAKFSIVNGQVLKDSVNGTHCYYPTLGLYAPCDMPIESVYQFSPVYGGNCVGGSCGVGLGGFGGGMMGGGGCAGGSCGGGGGRGLFRR
jgi:hypothetical protein